MLLYWSSCFFQILKDRSEGSLQHIDTTIFVTYLVYLSKSCLNFYSTSALKEVICCVITFSSSGFDQVGEASFILVLQAERVLDCNSC